MIKSYRKKKSQYQICTLKKAHVGTGQPLHGCPSPLPRDTQAHQKKIQHTHVLISFVLPFFSQIIFNVTI